AIWRAPVTAQKPLVPLRIINIHNILRKTVNRCICAIKAWHLFHDAPYPNIVKGKVAVVLRASAWIDSTSPPPH
ncbi:hypothetical protein PSHT_06039, partial [Puccinia striiformis]